MRGLPGRNPDSATADPSVLADRVESLASWVQDLDAQLRAASTLARDPKAAKELARALESWSKHGPKLEERITGRIELLAERLATVADTANTTAGALAGKQGEIAALRRDLEQSSARLEESLRELRHSGSSTEILELRQAVAALSGERHSRPREAQSDLMPAKADVLAERIDMLAKTVATTAAGLAGREGELATLRRSLDEAGARVDGVMGGLRASLDMLSAHVAGLDERTLELGRVPALGAYVEELGASLDALTLRVDTIATGVDAAAATLGNREREFAAMHRHFDEATSRIQSALGELETGLSALPTPGTIDPAVEVRLGSLGRQLETVTAHLTELEAATRDVPGVEPALEAVEVRLAHLGDRIEAMEGDRAAVAQELTTFASSWESKSARLEERLEASFTHPGVHHDEEREAAREERLSSLESRLETLFAQRVGAHDEERDAVWEQRLSSLESRLEALALVGGPDTEHDADTDSLVAALAARIDAVEQSPGADDSAQLRMLIDGLRMRLASTEKDLAGLVGPRDVGTRLDELARRLEAIEKAGPSMTAASPGASVASDGRHRVEMRALELRVEHSEVAARENREAVLTELERLAARIEWRLQQLEATIAAAPVELPPPDEGLGQLVPIRGEA